MPVQADELVTLNASVAPLVDDLIGRAGSLNIAVRRLANGATVVDAGIEVAGGLEAGRRVAEICMGGLGRVALRASDSVWPWCLDVSSQSPVLACLASQYAGWSLQHGEGKGAFRALGSGPARAMGSKEPLFEELGHRERYHRACMVIETDRFPPEELASDVAQRCGIEAESLTLILTPTSSLAGAVQVVGRVLEVAMHKVHTLEFPLSKVVDGLGSAPLCPPAPDFVIAMGRTNDAIIFAGQVHLFVDSDDADAEQLAAQLPSAASRDFGRPFAEIFKACQYDFYAIDPLLFSPARCLVTSLRTGRSFSAGKLHPELLDQSFS